MLSSVLKWNEHVAYIVKKSSRRLYMLRLLKRGNADKKTLIAVYTTCIRPILEYCNEIWHFNIPEYHSNDIERIQRRALKIIHPLSLSYNEALVVCNISTLHLRREQLRRTIFKNKVVPRSSPLSDLVEIAADQGYDLRAGRKFEPIKCTTNRFKNSFIPSSVEQFNASRT